MNIRHTVEIAFAAARDKRDQGATPGAVNRNRSMEFVEALAEALQRECQGRGSVAALSKHNPVNRSQFGMNELLFDITVCEHSSIESATSGKELSFVTNGLWIVESEMAKDKREALYDFNKLVLGCAENKLFVGSQVSDEEDYLRVLGAAANHCTGQLFLALVPHPSDWSADRCSGVRLWKWNSSKWVSLN